jgi:hypothetical protein
MQFRWSRQAVDKMVTVESIWQQGANITNAAQRDIL